MRIHTFVLHRRQSMKATTRRGAAGGLLAKKKKKAARGFMCGCGGSKSVSTISRAAAANISAVTTTPMKTATTASAVKPVSAAKTTVVSGYRDVDADDADASAEGTPSVDALLRQLRELERGVRELGVRERGDDVGAHGGNAPRRPWHRRSASDLGGGGGVGRLESESVAVVTESADPLGDFRQSMVQMIVENGITGGAELRELLQRFLSLNSARHHHLILRAFADVWEELFAGGGHGPAPPPLPATGISYRSRASKRPHARADTLATVP
ncbi:transcription repressor OFP8-like [Phragmites australis]|uniref:transcription repressor OFP8-like n=1 Tax=Phragmites australis TaxID=29695 RepID=UPI002D7A0B6F|nr:transcription repressor OFP8-like [Phragmites australis]